MTNTMMAMTTSKGNAPAFQFYAADWLADEAVSVMSLEEEGAYIRALCYCWREGSIPADEDKLSRPLKGASASVLCTVRDCFHISSIDPSRLIHARLENEREKQKEFADGQRARANHRWARSEAEGNAESIPTNHRNAADALPAGGMPVTCSSSTFPTTSSTSLVVSQIDGMSGLGETRSEVDKNTTSSDSSEELTPDQRLSSLLLFKVLKHRPDEISDQVYNRAVKDAKPVLASRHFDYVRSVLKYAKNDSWWLEQLKKAKFPMAYFSKSFDSIAEQMESAAPPSTAETTKPVDASLQEIKGRDTTTDPFAKYRLPNDSGKVE